jgi:hypothetical protein
VGGIASLPLTIGLYWLSGMGNELSLNMVTVGGFVAGYLAKRDGTAADSAAIGTRAGLVGSVPGLWLLSDLLGNTATLTGPTWFSLVGVGGALLFVGFLFGIGGFAGFVGAKVGGWLAVNLRDRQRPVAER